MSAPTFVVGDVHGHRDVLAGLLRDAGLLDANESWSGGDARLWLVGDLVDRGPDGVGAIRLVRRLERESAGAVRCLLGNHEAMLLAVHRFGSQPTSVGESFYELWQRNGGLDSDLEALTDDDAGWLTGLSPIATEGDWLILHADTTGYLALGRSAQSVAHTASQVLREGDVHAVDELLAILSDRMRLTEPEAVDALLAAYGGARILHGHTPIPFVREVDPRSVTEPLVYAGGRVTNVDHCLFAGGPGFVFRLD